MYQNSIIAENKLSGTDLWRISNLSTNHEVEGYASLTSVNRGEEIEFYVNTIAPTFSIHIFRMGWYQGLGGHLYKTIASLPGVSQPAFKIDERRMIECDWKSSYNLTIPDTWPSGVYLAKLITAPIVSLQNSSFERYIVFVVRDDQNPSAMLFQTCVNTYQAYNLWGDISLYENKNFPDESYKNRSYAVSFNRPYEEGAGSGHFLRWEYPMLRWLEKNGYAVNYSTNIDTDKSPEQILRHKVFLSVGHDEYWSLNRGR